MSYTHVNSFFSIYPDTIKDGEIVIGYKRSGSSIRIRFPNDFNVGSPRRDHKGRYRASDLALNPIIVHDLLDANTPEAWIGNNVTSDIKNKKVNTVTEHIRFADNATSVGINAFRGMKAFKSLRITKKIHFSDSSRIFRDCPNLCEVVHEGTLDEWYALGIGKVFGENTDINCRDGKAIYRISGTKKRTLVGFTPYGRSLKDVPLPKNISVIGPRVFKNRLDLTSVTIPSSVIKVDRMAFAECTMLKEVIILSSNAIICDDAFTGCTSLETVKFPNGYSSLSGKAFSGCPSLKRIVIENRIWKIPREKTHVLIPWEGMNREYYNLFAIKNEDYDTGSFNVYKKRSTILTNPELEEALWRFTDENIEWMKTLPCIFTKTNTLMDHSEPSEKAFLGKIDEIIIQDCGIKIKYRLSEIEFPHNLLVEHQKEFNMESRSICNRLYCEHWAIIENDIIRTLETLGVKLSE